MGITIIPKAKLNGKRNYPFMIRLGKRFINFSMDVSLNVTPKGKIKSSKK